MDLKKIIILFQYQMSLYQKNHVKITRSLQNPYKKRLAEIAKLANYEPIASILPINNDFNYTYAKQGHLKKKAKAQDLFISPQTKHEQKYSPNGPRLPKINEPKMNKIQNRPTNASEPNEQLGTEPDNISIDFGRYSLVHSPSSHSGYSEGNDKKNRVRYKIVKRQNEQYQDQTEEEYQSGATPGPGYYSITDIGQKRKQRRGLTDFSFGCKASRFIQKKKQQVDSQSSHPKEQVKIKQVVYRKKKIVPFLSCSLKQNDLAFKQKQKLPGPQDYHPRTGIEEELIKKIQRNFKGNFGVYESRFKQVGMYPHLGPGSYLNLKNQNPQQPQSPSYYFLSKKKRLQ